MFEFSTAPWIFSGIFLRTPDESEVCPRLPTNHPLLILRDLHSLLDPLVLPVNEAVLFEFDEAGGASRGGFGRIQGKEGCQLFLERFRLRVGSEIGGFVGILFQVY